MKKTQTNISRSGAKWLPGAMAVASTAASSHAATVQITFPNSFISHSDSASNLDTDIGGDGIADLSGFGSFTFFNQGTNYGGAINRQFAKADLRLGFPSYAKVAYAKGQINSYIRGTFYGNFSYFGFGYDTANVGTVFSVGFARSFYFLETVVEGLGSRAGWLEVQATSSTGPVAARIDVLRFVFDEANFDAPNQPAVYAPAFAEFTAVPEPSSFALLTLGAAGLLARRRRKQAA